MAKATFTLSAFGDEISADLEEQLRLLRQLAIPSLELRSAWDTNVLRLSDDQVAQVRRLCQEYGIGVGTIGSPIGKSPITDPSDREEANLRRILQVAEALGARQVRVFSFYPPKGESEAGYDRYVDEAARRLRRLAELAGQAGVLLVLENEREIVGDTPERCHALLQAVGSASLRFAWDPANFVLVGVERPMDRGWGLLGPYVAHVHVKDARLAEGKVCAAGEGDGQVPELLDALREAGYQGFLSLEPHLAKAGRAGGFSGPEGMTYAANALRGLLESMGLRA